MELDRGGSVQVGAWFEIGVELGQWAFDRRLTFESLLESRGALRPVADAEEGDAHVGEFSAFARAVRRDSDHGVVPMAARELAERRGVAWLGQGKFRGDEQLTGFQPRGVDALEKVFCGDAALAFLPGDDEGRAEGERAARQLRSRIR